MKKRFAGAALLCAVALSLAACGGSSSSSSETTAAGGAAAETTAGGAASGGAAAEGGKVVRVAAVDPQVALDPQQYTYSIIMKITDNITESLLMTKGDGSLEPLLLAAMPEISEDQLTYSFELLPDVKFHNGETLKASDVKYSYERLIKMAKMATLLENVAGYDELSAGTADELSGFQIQDDTHFTITLKKPYAPFLSVLSTAYTAIYPEAACEEAGDTWGMQVLYGTGPFKLDSYQTSVGAVLSRFDDYHGGATKLDGVDYKFIEDVNTQVLEYQAGNVDYVDVDPSVYPIYSSNPELKDEMHGFQPTGCYSLTLNVKTFPDAKVREAIALSIDRKAICESILHGTATVPTSYIPAGIIGHDDTLPEFEYNPERAKELLAEAGYADGIDVRVTVNTKYQGNVAIATAFQEQAKAAGIRVQVEQVDSAAWSDMKMSGGVDCGISNWYVDYSDPESMLYPMTKTDTNSSFWHNEEFDQLMEDGIATTDTAERQEIYAKAEHIMTREDWATTPLYNETKYYLLNPSITGFEIDSTFRMFWKDADIQ
ncbi:MAG TPA: ABC transporter substrate-binding protein [Candidatus Lachnoclostridium stercoravium]|uniref:ABC transporter substrate-binding protein n=1 Tax=Candidatus Lachnoclostridium stercoravium TaxID=2838633 RepID=A0A9D2KQM8_9FIRM|nr:ABC transporter substrate-binding protein [Candidatus Lachnoclostridium stercoravium]